VWPLLAALIPRTVSIKVLKGVIQLASAIRPQQAAAGAAGRTSIPDGYTYTEVDEAEARKRRFTIAHVDGAVKYTSPSGPVLLLSKRAAEGSRLFWRFQVNGNNSWSVGIISDSKRGEDQELHASGKVGLDSDGLMGGVMQSQKMHGSWVSAAFDGRTGTARFTVRGKTIEQTSAFKGPIRLALSTFSGCVVTMSQTAEEEAADDCDQAGLPVGAEVHLSHDYAEYDDACSGPLKPGDVGTLLVDDESSKPYKILAPNGKKWWYHRKAIVSARGAPAGEFCYSLATVLKGSLYVGQ
jgi:hypothetical protein